MSGNLPPDQHQRDQAVDPGLSVHVEAPAGSGKTTVLMKRYLTLLAQVREPEEILALTFTRKAAGELRSRLQGVLLDRSDTKEPVSGDGGLQGAISLGEERDRGDRQDSSHAAELKELGRKAAYRHVDKEGVLFLERLQVSTFHSFCAQLLRLVPQAAGLPLDFRLLEEHEAEQLQEEAVERLRREVTVLPVGDPVRQALVQRLVRLNNAWPRLAAELRDLLARRDILRDFITLARQSRDPAAYARALQDHLHEMLLPGLTRLAEEFGQAEIGRRWPELQRYFADAGSILAESLPEEIPGTGLADLPAWRAVAQALLTQKGACYKSFTHKFPKNIKATPWCALLQNLPAELVELLNYYRELPTVLLQADEVEAVQDLIILLNKALTIYDGLCLARRSLDFIGLEQYALRVLSNDDLPELLGRLDRRLTHLLVDEFQDTSVTQMTLLCRLLGAWQGEAGRSLMVVGDPKQSIYGWRQAQVELFTRSRAAGRLPCAEAPPFTVLTLETNFRSTQTLIEWTNAVFGETIMSDPEVCGVGFHPARPRPGPVIGQPPTLNLFGSPDREEARIWEADWLAAEIARLQVNLAGNETVGILLFTRRHLSTYLEAWRRAGLSLRVKDGLPLADSLGVQHLHNLVKALVRPHDDVAWAGLLRGFAGPQPLGLLADLDGKAGEFWSARIGRFAESTRCPEEVRSFVQALASARQQVGRQPLREILTDWLQAVNGWEKAAAWEGGPQGVANLRAYLDLVAAAEAHTPEGTWQRTTALLAKAYQPPDPRAQDSPVEVLTVHAAKGLEYDYIYVPFLDWEPLKTGGSDIPFLLEEVPGTGTAVMALNRAYLQEEQSILYQTLKKRAQRNALAEARRLFYVAVTRAKKRLWLSGVMKSDSSGKWRISRNSPLDWLRRHYPGQELLPGGPHLWEPPQLEVTIGAERPSAGGAVHFANLPPMAAGQEILEPETPEALTTILPGPYEVEPEPWPYEVQFPSQLAQGGEPEMAARGDQTADPGARLRGELIHRLLEGVAQGWALPPAAAVAAALRPVAESLARAMELAEDMLAEVRACQADPFLGPFLAPNLPFAKSEWRLEAWHTDLTLFRGQIDRLLFDGQQWWLLDYKSSRPAPGQTWEEFMAAEAERYRPQLLAYREMAAKFLALPSPASINAVLYFTAGQRHVLL